MFILVRSFFREHKVFTLGLFFLFILLLKNPLSPNNIISNLGPLPDSIHYLNPLISLSQGKGFVISYKDRSVSANVPFLYTLILYPAYAFFGDIRFFYITNVLLTVASTILFYKIIVRLFFKKMIKAILFFAFVTNYVIYWYPSVAMAEGLLIPLYLLSIWLFLQPLNIARVILISSLVVAFFATKYIAGILSVTLILIFIIKIISSKIPRKRKYFLSALFFSILFTLFSIFLYIEYVNKNINILNNVGYHLQQLAAVFLSLFNQTGFKAAVRVADLPSETYSRYYQFDNYVRYLAGIMGGPLTVAGKNFYILPIIVGMISLFAIFTNLFIRKNRLLSFYFFISIVGTFIFVGNFFIVDGRYLFVFIPAFLLIFGLFLDALCNFLISMNRKIYATLLLGFILLAILLNVSSSVMNQININFFQPERAIIYDVVETMNLTANMFNTALKPVIISVVPPHMIDFYSNHRYELLPLSRNQYFMAYSEEVWDISPKINLIDVYKEYLATNRAVLVSVYGTDKLWINLDMQKIKEEFDLSLVTQGCNDLCNLYKLKLKPGSQ